MQSKSATEFGKYLGHALANLAAACDPAVIVIGGGVSKAGEVLLDYIKGPFKEMHSLPDKDTEFALANLQMCRNLRSSKTGTEISERYYKKNKNLVRNI